MLKETSGPLELPAWLLGPGSPLSLTTCHPARQSYNSVSHLCSSPARAVKGHSDDSQPPLPASSRAAPLRSRRHFRRSPQRPGRGNGAAPPAAPGRERRWGGRGLRADPGVGRPGGSCGAVLSTRRLKRRKP